MIKKFKEFNEDSKKDWNIFDEINKLKKEKNDSLFKILPLIEVEDQFLRLKEVYDCPVSISSETLNNQMPGNKPFPIDWYGKIAYSIYIYYRNTLNTTNEIKDIDPQKEIDIHEEAKQVKLRIEHQYPVLVYVPNKLLEFTNGRPDCYKPIIIVEK